MFRHVDSWSENHWLFIIMEHAEAGDLGHVVASYSMNKPTVSEEQLLRYIVDIGRGLQYLHDNRVLHRSGSIPSLNPLRCRLETPSYS